MANREEGAAMPNQRQGQEQPHHQDAVGQRCIHLNWSNFKPQFSGKPEEDAEAHLLHSNDWMEAHKQLFHAWRSFTFDENTKTIDSYVIRIGQVANLSAYRELQILEVFKNTLPTKLYWILFPIEDLR